MALIGPNGTGKTTLLRILAGDLTASDGAVTRSGGLGVMRQFIGKVRDDTTVRDLLVSVAPEPVRLRGAGGRPHRARHDGARDRAGPARLRAGARRLGRRRRLRVGDALGRLHRRGPRHAVRAGPVAPGVDAVRRRAEARRARGAAARTRRGARARRARQLPRRARPSAGSRRGSSSRPRPCCSSATTASCSTGWPPASPPSSRAGAATPCGCTPGGSRRTTRPGPSATTAWTSSVAAGTRSSRRSRPWSSCTGRRRRTTTGWPRACRPPRPGCASSRRPGRPRPCRCARRCPCGSPGAARPSERSWRPGSSCGSTATS